MFDLEMRYIRVNQALTELNGMPEEAHIGVRPTDVLPELAEQVLGVFRRVIDAEETVSDVEVSGTTPAAPGVERHLLSDWYPIREDGEVVGVGVFVSDITSRVRAERGITLVAAVGEALDAALGVDERLERLAELLVPALADFCTIAVTNPDGGTRIVAGAHVEPDRQDALIAAGTPPAVDHPDALVEAAMVARGRSLGTITLGMGPSARRYDEQDVALARQLSARAAVAIDNARLFEGQQRIAATLQRSMLPPRLPAIPGIEAAARFSPMGDGHEVGGDFYDLFDVNDGWAAVMGDVCGKGVEAAALTSLARHGIRIISRGTPLPSDVLRELNEVFIRDRGLDARFSTALYVRLVLGAGAVVATVASAGHPLPLLVRAGGRVETVGEPGMLLGPFADVRIVNRSAELRPGDALVLYTDGVTEARRAGEMFGEERLRGLVGRHAGRSADDIAEAIESAVVAFHGGELGDDLAVLVLRVLDRPLR